MNTSTTNEFDLHVNHDNLRYHAKIDEYFAEHALLKYASRYWAEHAQRPKLQIREEGRTFLQENRLTATASRAMFAEQPDLFDPSSAGPEWHGLHIAAIFGLTKLLLNLWQQRMIISQSLSLFATITDGRHSPGLQHAGIQA